MASRDEITAECLAEETVAALFLGSLSGEERARVEQHLGACASCRRMVAELARTSWGQRGVGEMALTEAPERGTSIGRYVVIDGIGQGGMGVVYAAYDPELDRKVALKLVRADAGIGPEAQARLQQEAQAMARLAHPNVVRVYDIGVWGERLFVAMELVDGESLRAWLGRERPWREVLAVLTAAGAGLAAAHAAGLVHGDFKPDNVLLSRDGHVSVTDFGLARLDARLAVERLAGDGAATESAWSRVLGGTPAYMAPELWRGTSGGAASDQFAFCVTLYEALYGTRPFAGASLTELAERMERGERAPLPREPRMPASVRAALLRGLAATPAARFPSMADLLAALGAYERRRRRWRALGASAALVTAVVGAGVVSSRRAHTVCSGAAAMTAAVFGGAQAAAVERALRGAGAPFADATWASVRSRLHDYLGRWAAMRTDACQATRVRAEQSEELLELRMQCLDRQLLEAHALVDVLAHADGDVAAHAVQAVDHLPPIEACADTRALRGVPQPPAAAKAALDRVAADLGRAASLERAGRDGDAAVLVRTAITRAHALDFAPLEAEALALRGQLEAHDAHVAEAKHSALAALAAAERGHVDVVMARAANIMTNMVGIAEIKRDADEWSRLAEAALAHVPEEVRELIRVLRVRAEYLLITDRTEEALAAAERGLSIAARALPADDLDIADLLGSKARALVQLRRRAQALVELGRARDIHARVLGLLHPDMMQIWADIGDANGLDERYDEALAAQRHSLETAAHLVGIRGVRGVAQARLSIAENLTSLERYDEAELVLRRAIQELEHVPENATNLAIAWSDMGSLALGRRQYAVARTWQRRAEDAMRRTFGDDHSNLAEAITLAGDIELEAGRPAEALRAFEHALAIVEKGIGPAAPEAFNSLGGVGRARLALHDAVAALPPLERAFGLAQRYPVGPSVDAEVRFALARALAASGGDHARAHRLAGEARALYSEALARSSSRHSARPLAEVERWLTSQR